MELDLHLLYACLWPLDMITICAFLSGSYVCVSGSVCGGYVSPRESECTNVSTYHVILIYSGITAVCQLYEAYCDYSQYARSWDDVVSTLNTHHNCRSCGGLRVLTV